MRRALVGGAPEAAVPVGVPCAAGHARGKLRPGEAVQVDCWLTPGRPCLVSVREATM